MAGAGRLGWGEGRMWGGGVRVEAAGEASGHLSPVG